MLHNQAPLHVEAVVKQWPPHGEIYHKPGGYPPVVLFTQVGMPAGQALDWAFGAYGQGDCNGDGKVDAGDPAAAALEFFDDDGQSQAHVTQAGFRGRPIGCDGNGDGWVDAADMTWIVLGMFGLRPAYP